jgi:putative SOS response-associated peptidase YedK
MRPAHCAALRLKPWTLTGEPNKLVAPIHNRMPVILRPDNYAIWLGENPADAEALRAACAPYQAEDMCAYPIGTRVNNPRNDDAGILELMSEAGRAVQRSL